jgi:hypothetical protein
MPTYGLSFTPAATTTGEAIATEAITELLEDIRDELKAMHEIMSQDTEIEVEKEDVEDE